MRRGGLRGWLPFGVALLATMLVVACQGETPPGQAMPTDPATPPSTSTSPSPTPPPVDPTAAVEVCGLALAATETTITVFVDQTEIAELAVAQGDNAAMVAAAKQIDEQFVSLAEAFTKLAQRPVDAKLRDRLTRTAEALTEMSSDYYLGSTVDTRVKLAEFRAGLEETCATMTSAASSSAG